MVLREHLLRVVRADYKVLRGLLLQVVQVVQVDYKVQVERAGIKERVGLREQKEQVEHLLRVVRAVIKEHRVLLLQVG